MLILNDRTPIHSHDPALVAAQLRQIAEDLDVSAVLLDFQRPGCAAAAEVAAAVSCSMPCPVGVSELYADGLNTAVFINAPVLTQSLAEALAPWQGRELWLEAALSRAGWALTPEGSVPEAPPSAGEYPLSDPALYCCYRVEEAESALHFYIERGPEMLEALLDEGEKLGVTRAVGLFQELGERLWP